MARPQSKSRKKTPQGLKFEQRCKHLGITPSYLFKMLDINNVQSISHWKYRGVPKDYAIPVASILKCHPADISTLKLEESAMKRDPNEKSVSDLVSLVAERAEELDPDTRAQLYRTIASFFS